eukprot:CAMPEP_0115889278 /NCGR_PEP_ID=MMETSP0287-20121206/32743_1 /TAXON_ID=412157 /ORGANISM="Chrysochromulina rotalis, Strain UIO044" /LENGTH=231 /DNA_ID=CAMNT_0003345993 /DNA_START=107 /DNA_END=802 /DNA_ORIENTATION=+
MVKYRSPSNAPLLAGMTRSYQMNDHSARDPPRLAIAWLMLAARVATGRSRRKKANQERKARTGKKIRVGSHLDGPQATQCPLCDKAKHGRCLDLKHCKSRKRSPPGVNKRQKDRNSRREHKKALKKDGHVWQVLSSYVVARLQDGEPTGYPADQAARRFVVCLYDTNGANDARVQVGSEVRFSGFPGEPAEPVVHVVAPRNRFGNLLFILEMTGVPGDMALVGKVEVKVTE